MSHGMTTELIEVIEPGGYLQWDEIDLGTWFASAVNPSASKAAATELVARWKSQSAKCGIVFEYVAFQLLLSDLLISFPPSPC